MASSRNLKPERPISAGVEEEIPESSEIEGAMLLTNDAFPRLVRSGFTRQQILLWAETYIAERAAGDLEAFLDWIKQQEQSAQPD
jgi:hypothetical protein